MEQYIESAVAQFRTILTEQIARQQRMEQEKKFTDYEKLDKIIIGICGGDGIGPIISAESERLLQFILKDEIAAGKIELAKTYLQGKDPGKCLFLGDTCHDFEVARAVGADCILIAFGHQSRKQLESCGCPVIDSLLELPSLLKE